MSAKNPTKVSNIKLLIKKGKHIRYVSLKYFFESPCLGIVY